MIRHYGEVTDFFMYRYWDNTHSRVLFLKFWRFRFRIEVEKA